MPNNKKKNRNSNNRNEKSIKKRRIPMATAISVSSRTPQITQTARGTRVKSHQIILDNFVGESSFTIDHIRFNAGLGTFPWLANIAANYEKYHVHKLHMHFIPSKATTITPGSVYLAADYDPEDNPNPTLQSLSTYESMTSGKVYEEVILKVDTSRIHTTSKWLKVRDHLTPFDLSLYDACTLLYGSKDGDGDPIGQIWLWYDIEFISCQIEQPALNSRLVAQLTNGSAIGDIQLTISQFRYLAMDVFQPGRLPVTTYDFMIGAVSQRGYILEPGNYLVRATMTIFASAPATSIEADLEFKYLEVVNGLPAITDFPVQRISQIEINPNVQLNYNTVVSERVITIPTIVDSSTEGFGFLVKTTVVAGLGGTITVHEGKVGLVIQQI